MLRMDAASVPHPRRDAPGRFRIGRHPADPAFGPLTPQFPKLSPVGAGVIPVSSQRTVAGAPI